MTATPIVRPGPTEYAPTFAVYVDRVPAGDVLAMLAQQIEETTALLGGLSATDADLRYAPDKWSIKEVVGHLADTERIMTYRALCFARGERAALPGFDENAYVQEASFSTRSLADLTVELRAVRSATIPFFASLDAATLERRGTTSNGREYTVRALAYIIAGHERHHVAILRERYLAGRSPRRAD